MYHSAFHVKAWSWAVGFISWSTCLAPVPWCGDWCVMCEQSYVSQALRSGQCGRGPKWYGSMHISEGFGARKWPGEHMSDYLSFSRL
jgi:hypothetical protein